MKFVIVGAGDVGTSLATRLATHQHDVVLIEKDPDKIGPEFSGLDLQTMIGNGCNPEILQEAGLENADYFIAVTDVDEVNLAACFISKLANSKPKRIARVRDLPLHSNFIPDRLIAEHFDLVINPDQVGAEYLTKLFKIPGARETVEFADGKIRVIGLTVAEHSALLNMKLKSLKTVQQELPILIIAVMRAGKIIVPRGEDKIKAGDILYVATVPEKTKLVFELVGRELHAGQTAMIWGGSILARFLAFSLEEQGCSIKLILSDPEEAQAMADELKTALILHGKGTEQALLEEENVGEMDAFIAATADEENNVLAALLAKKLGVKTAMAVVNKASYLPLVSAIGVDVVMSARLAAASAILRHVHSQSIISEFALQHEGAGFIEIDTSRDNPLMGVKLKDLALPYGILLCAIVREGEAIIPSGEDIVQLGDRVVIFVVKSAIRKLEKLLDLKLELFA